MTEPNENINLWKPATGKQIIANPKKFRKKTWGLLEVLNSFIILICAQLLMSLVFVVVTLTDAVRKGVDLSDTKAQNDLVQGLLSSGPVLALSAISMYLIWYLMMWYSTKYRGHKSFFKDFWLKVNWKTDIWIGAIVAIVLTAVELGVFALLGNLGIDLSSTDNGAVFTEQKGVWLIILAFFVVPILGPFMEEMFFRGFLMQALIKNFRRGNVHEPRSAFGLWVLNTNAHVFNGYLVFRNWCYKHKYILAAILSSLAFGLMHFQGHGDAGDWILVAATGTIGLTFALIALKTRRLGIGIFGHIFFNSISVLSVFLLR